MTFSALPPPPGPPATLPPPPPLPPTIAPLHTAAVATEARGARRGRGGGGEGKKETVTERGRARETEIEREEKIGEDEIGVWDQRRCVLHNPTSVTGRS